MRFPSEFLVVSRHLLFLSHALIQVHRMNVRCIYSNVLTECSFLSAFFFLTSSLSLVDPLDCIILFLFFCWTLNAVLLFGNSSCDSNLLLALVHVVFLFLVLWSSTDASFSSSPMSFTRSSQTRKAIYYSEGKNLSLGVYLPPGRAFYGHSLPFSLFLTYRFLPSPNTMIRESQSTPFMPRVSSLPSASNLGKSSITYWYNSFLSLSLSKSFPCSSCPQCLTSSIACLSDRLLWSQSVQEKEGKKTWDSNTRFLYFPLFSLSHKEIWFLVISFLMSSNNVSFMTRFSSNSVAVLLLFPSFSIFLCQLLSFFGL